MKESIIAFIIGCIIGGIAAYINYVSSPIKRNNPIIIERYIPIDTTENVISKVNNTKYIIDSLQQANDSLTGKLQIANYKLERIRYYNDVAKRGNNIKFLRSWINRVLDEND